MTKVTQRHGLLLGLALLLCAGPQAFAQQVQLSAGFVGNPQVVFITELMVLSENAQGTRPPTRPLFNVSLANSGAPKNVYLTMQFSYNGREIGGQGKTSTFQLQPGRLVLDASKFSAAPYRLSGFRFGQNDFNALMSGSGGTSVTPATLLPSGNYILLWSVVDATTNEVLSSAPAVLNLSNPTGYVQLMGPGVPAGSPSRKSPENTVTRGRVMFSWVSDVTTGFRIRVWEDPRGTRNFQDVINTVPVVDAQTNAPSYDYTGSGTREMQEGRMYFWQVEGQVNSLAGSYTVQSMPNFFYVEPIGGGGSDNPRAMLDEIKQLLRNKYSVEPDWLDEAEFVSFGATLEGNTVQNSTDLRALLNLLKR